MVQGATNTFCLLRMRCSNCGKKVAEVVAVARPRPAGADCRRPGKPRLALPPRRDPFADRTAQRDEGRSANGLCVHVPQPRTGARRVTTAFHPRSFRNSIQCGARWWLHGRTRRASRTPRLPGAQWRTKKASERKRWRTRQCGGRWRATEALRRSGGEVRGGAQGAQVAALRSWQPQARK